MNHPVELAEYGRHKGLLDDPAFAWWAPHTLKKKNSIIAKVKSRTKKKTHKYGHVIPRSVADAIRLDKENGNNLWSNAIKKEMSNVRVASDVLEKGQKRRPGSTFLECYMIFDIKMDFTRKARFVANGS